METLKKENQQIMNAKEWEIFRKCPKCGERDISETTIGIILSRENPNKIYCPTCGFSDWIKNISLTQKQLGGNKK